MKAIIVDDVIACEAINVYDSEKYPQKDGVYLVDDGVLFYFVMVDYNIATLTNIITATSIPRKCVTKEYEKIGERDVDLLQKQLAELNKGIQDLRVDIDDGFSDKMDEGSGSVNIKDLTKLIAVAQKPELLDKKV